MSSNLFPGGLRSTIDSVLRRLGELAVDFLIDVWVALTNAVVRTFRVFKEEPETMAGAVVIALGLVGLVLGVAQGLGLL